MTDKTSVNVNPSRRQFMKLLSMGSLFCFGCSHLCAFAPSSGENQKTPDVTEKEKHKFLNDAKMSFKDVFGFAYRGNVSLMNLLADKIGKDKFMKLLKEAASESAARGAKQMAKNLPKNDLAAWTTSLRKPDYFWKNVLTFEIVEDTEKAFEVKITECLWAKTIRDLKAGDIGYAMICHPDFAMVRAFNPKMKLIRTKTLMQSHDCCNHRWVIEG